MQSAATPKPSASDLIARVQVMARRYLVTLRKFWWIPALTVTLGLGLSIWKSSNLPPSFLSTAQMDIQGQFQFEGSIRIAETENYIGTQFALILSDQVGQRARKKILAQHPDWIPVPVNLDISQTARTSFVMIRATGMEPLYTQAYLDAVMQEYMALKKEMRAEKSDSMTSSIRNQQILLEKETDADEQALLRFQKENNIGMVQEQGNSAGAYLSQLEHQLAGLKTELNLLKTLNLDQNIDREHMATQTTVANIAVNEKTAASLNRVLDPTLANNYGPMNSYERTKQDLRLLEARRDEYLKTMRPKNPKVLDIEEEIERAKHLMETYKAQSMDVLNIRKESIIAQIKNLESVIAEQSVKAMDLSLKLAEYDRIKLKLERDKQQYDRMITTLHGVDVYKNVDQDRLTILETASPAISVKPGVAKTIMSGFATGLLAGLAVLFLLDKLDDRIGSVVECQGNFKEYPILGQIPREDMSGDLALLVPYDPRQSLTESFKALRSSLLFAPVEGVRPKTIMISSAVDDEGKTVIAANFALTLAFSGAKTLLVDSDLTSGRLHDIFGVQDDPGLVDILQHDARWSEAVVQTSIENLYLLPRGENSSHPAEHFFGAFLKEVYCEFDYIIFDSASVVGNVDTLSFSPLVDGVLFVIRFGNTSTKKAQTALNLLDARQVNIIGLICNEV